MRYRSIWWNGCRASSRIVVGHVERISSKIVNMSKRGATFSESGWCAELENGKTFLSDKHENMQFRTVESNEFLVRYNTMCTPRDNPNRSYKRATRLRFGRREDRRSLVRIISIASKRIFDCWNNRKTKTIRFQLTSMHSLYIYSIHGIRFWLPSTG